ncbi:hypothetical protein LN050_03565 [Comamonadaceae bacterium M7527]|nr:hypothetical protein LN050_03565 [Comamonadaceae bacterium M7527]
MPIGELVRGTGDVTVDRSVNLVSGSADSQAEGVIVFNTPGTVSITGSVRVSPGENLAAGKSAPVLFWFGALQDDGTFKKIDNSVTYISVHHGDGLKTEPLRSFTFRATAGEKIGFFALSDGADHAFIQAEQGLDMLKIDITLTE